MVDVATALNILVPAAKYYGSLTANDQESYDALEWNDDRRKPTFVEILDASPAVDKSELKFTLSKIKLERKTGGFTYKGNTFSTGPKSIVAYTMNAVAARENMTYTVNWKLPNEEFIVLGRDDIIGLVVAITNFVNDLTAMESDLSAGIDEGYITTEQEITDAINSVPNEYPVPVIVEE